MRHVLKSKMVPVVLLLSILALVAAACAGPRGEPGPTADIDEILDQLEDRLGTIVVGSGLAVGSADVGWPNYSAVEGTALLVIGSGFEPGESVLLSIGGTDVGSATANDNGFFSVTTDALPGSLGPDGYTVSAEGDQGTMMTAPLEIVSSEK